MLLSTKYSLFFFDFIPKRESEIHSQMNCYRIFEILFNHIDISWKKNFCCMSNNSHIGKIFFEKKSSENFFVKINKNKYDYVHYL
jgi:hypothetical protein